MFNHCVCGKFGYYTNLSINNNIYSRREFRTSGTCICVNVPVGVLNWKSCRHTSLLYTIINPCLHGACCAAVAGDTVNRVTASTNQCQPINVSIVYEFMTCERRYCNVFKILAPPTTPVSARTKILYTSRTRCTHRTRI
jgi:hypothetical protein